MRAKFTPIGHSVHQTEKEMIRNAASLAIAFFCSIHLIANAKEITYLCKFTNSVGMIWNNGGWRPQIFQPKQTPFTIRMVNGNVEASSVKEHFSSMFSCESFSVAGTDRELFDHIRCIGIIGSNPILMFNQVTGNGSLVHSVGAGYPNSWVRKDDIGIEVFSCTR